MSEEQFADRLAVIKLNEKPEVVLLIADDKLLMNMVVAWAGLEIKHKIANLPITGGSEREIWDWLWKCTDYKTRELKERIGCSHSEQALENKLKILIGNHVIYPDGTVNSYVQRYLRERVIKLFNVSANKRNLKSSGK